jgi:glycosyltransferase involved in cell wall biosynthesis
MSLDEFRARVVALCEECFAADSPAPVIDACTRLRRLITADAHRRELQYRVLRDVVDGAARVEDARPYLLLVAIHDSLLRAEAFLPPQPSIAQLRYFDEAYYLEQHPDVAAAVRAGKFGDAFEHFVTCGALEGRSAHPLRPALRLAPPAPERSARDAAGSAGGGRWLGRWLGRLRGHMGNGTSHGAARDRLDVGERLGVNLIAFHSANLGLGVSARHYYRFLVESGLEVCPIDVPVQGNRSGHDRSYADQWLPLDVPAPHAVNLFVMNPKDIADQLAKRYPAVQDEGKVNVALPFWELPRLPRSWLPQLNAMDVVAAASGFLKYAMLTDLDGPRVVELAHPLYVPGRVAPDRRRFGIGDGKVAFVCSFEMASDINRKNPFAAIDAFESSLGQDPRALLIVKVNNSRSEPSFAPHVERLRAAARRCANIRVFDEVLPYRDVLTLFASCDVLVSLHRAEGLGLVMMEAMTLGKPVVATAWSGNMAFTTECNSCLVGYDLVPVRNATQAAYRAGVIADDAVWADARVDEAAQWLTRLAGDRELRERIGARAAADLADYQRRIDVRELVAAIRNAAARRGVAVS